MKTRRFFILLLIALLPFVECAGQESGWIGGIYYTLDAENFTATVSMQSFSSPYESYKGDIVIPETLVYEGNVYSVTSIGERAFYSAYSMTSVIIPKTVTSIEKLAFWECRGLTSITKDYGICKR